MQIRTNCNNSSFDRIGYKETLFFSKEKKFEFSICFVLKGANLADKDDMDRGCVHFAAENGRANGL